MLSRVTLIVAALSSVVCASLYVGLDVWWWKLDWLDFAAVGAFVVHVAGGAILLALNGTRATLRHGGHDLIRSTMLLAAALTVPAAAIIGVADAYQLHSAQVFYDQATARQLLDGFLPPWVGGVRRPTVLLGITAGACLAILAVVKTVAGVVEAARAQKDNRRPSTVATPAAAGNSGVVTGARLAAAERISLAVLVGLVTLLAGIFIGDWWLAQAKAQHQQAGMAAIHAMDAPHGLEPDTDDCVATFCLTGHVGDDAQHRRVSRSVVRRMQTIGFDTTGLTSDPLATTLESLDAYRIRAKYGRQDFLVVFFWSDHPTQPPVTEIWFSDVEG